MVVTPEAFLPLATPSPPVLIPAINVDMPVIVHLQYSVQPFPTIPLLFIYQPKTIDKAIALPGDVLLLNSVAISVEPLPTLIVIESYDVKIPTVLIPDADDALIFPVTLPVTSPVTSPVISPVTSPRNVVAVTTPVTVSYTHLTLPTKLEV